jgi:hypothetical protein
MLNNFCGRQEPLWCKEVNGNYSKDMAGNANNAVPAKIISKQGG